jgi:hypothetical protein
MRVLKFLNLCAMFTHWVNRPIAVYTIVGGLTNKECADEVTKKLEEGYVLYGEPFVSTQHFCQAMTKYRKYGKDY